MQRLALFDIDCTLIDAHGAGGRAIFAAIEETLGVTGALDGYTFHGRTDPAIVRDLAVRWGLAPEQADERLDDCLRRYVALLRDEVAEGHIEVLAGRTRAGDGAGRRPPRRARAAYRQRGRGRGRQAGADRCRPALQGRRLWLGLGLAA